MRRMCKRFILIYLFADGIITEHLFVSEIYGCQETCIVR